MSLQGSIAYQARQLLSARTTWCWLVAIMLPGIWLARGGWDEPTDQRLMHLLGLERTTFAAGGFWEVATYGFLHGHGIHLILNALLILMIGARIEHYVGGKMLSTALLGGILGGGLLHLLFSPGTLVGISGGCAALILLLGKLSPDSQMAPLRISASNLGKGILIAEGVLMLLHPQSGVSWFSSGGHWLEKHGLGSWFLIGHACHFGGGLAGWLVGIWIMRAPVSLATLQKQRARRENAAASADQKRRPR